MRESAVDALFRRMSPLEDGVSLLRTAAIVTSASPTQRLIIRRILAIN
jgi:hypothetical protein